MILLSEHFKIRWRERISPTVPTPECIERWMSRKDTTMIVSGIDEIKQDGDKITRPYVYWVNDIGALIFLDKSGYPYTAVTVKTLSMTVQPWAV